MMIQPNPYEIKTSEDRIKRYEWRYFGLYSCALFAMAIFIPYVFDYDFAESGPFCETEYGGPIMSKQVLSANVAIMGISTLMLWEALLDLISSNLSFSVWFPRLQMLMAIFLTTFIFYFSPDESNERKLVLYVCCSYIRINFTKGALLFNILGDYKKDTQLPTKLQIGLFLWNNASTVLYAFNPFVKSSTFFILTMVTFVITGIVLILTFVWGITKCDSCSTGDESHDSGLQKNVAINFICLVLYTFTYSMISVSYGNRPWCAVGSGEINGYIILDLIIAIIIHLLPTKLARRDADVIKSFVRYISNEIRTPLNVAFIGLQLLSGNMNYDMSQEVVGDSTQACSSAIGILNDLLLYDKVEDGKMTLDREDVYVRSFIVNCISKFQTQADQKSIHLVYATEEYLSNALDKITINVDVNKMMMVVRNLVSNALKFTPNGGEIQVKVRYDGELCQNDRSEGVIRIEVHDSGCGISKEKQAILFNQTFEFDAAGLQYNNGAGLGLWLGEKIVTQHGGHIGVYSGANYEGSGSTFYVELKAKFNYKEDRKVLRSCNVTFDHSLMILDDKIDLPLRQTPARFSLYPDKRYRHALVADDSDLNRKMMCNVLGKYFQDIVQASNGQQAVDLVQSDFSFDYIFMDQVMPVMNGSEAIRAIRNLNFINPIIAVTGNTSTEEIIDLLANGADKILTKPLNIKDLERIFDEFDKDTYSIYKDIAPEENETTPSFEFMRKIITDHHSSRIARIIRSINTVSPESSLDLDENAHFSEDYLDN